MGNVRIASYCPQAKEKLNHKRLQFERLQCTFPNCLKQPLRLRSHLRQTHRITDKATIDLYFEQSVVLLDNKLVESESESHSSLPSFLSDDENDIIRQMTKRESVANEIFFDQGSETGDLDWVAEASLELMANKVVLQRPSSQASFSASESDDNDFEYFSDDDIYDFEDLEDKFLFSSLEEDAMLSRFTKWLTSIDGIKKPLTQAN